MADPKTVDETAETLAPETEVIDNPDLPPEIFQFRETQLESPFLQLTEDQWSRALHGVEIQDKKQQIKLRPYFACGVFLLLISQNVGIWFITVWALQRGQLADLQLIFSTLIAGTLTQSYFILRFITNKVFSDIDYHNGEGDKDK